MSRPRTKNRRRFQLAPIDALEDRTLLSTVAVSPGVSHAVHPIVNQANSKLHQKADAGAGQGGLSNPTQQVALVDQVLGQINPIFAQFSQQFFALEGRYFASLDSPKGADAIDIDGFRSEVGTLVSNLSQGVFQVINNVPGGAGLLGTFVTTRLGSEMSGSLRGQLTSLKAVGDDGMTRAGFAYSAQESIGSALNSTTNFVRLYDESLSYAVMGFFNGTFGFVNRPQNAAPPSQQAGAADLTPAETVLGSIFRYFGNFSEQFRDARAQYFDNGDLQGFRNRVGRLVQNLETDTLNAVNAVPGRGGPLSRYLDARIDSSLSGSLSGTLLSLPDARSTPLGQAGFTAASDIALLNTLLAVQNDIRLYDSSLAYVANGFFNAYAGRYLKGATGSGNGSPTSPRTSDGGLSNRSALVDGNTVQAEQYINPYNPGGFLGGNFANPYYDGIYSDYIGDIGGFGGAYPGFGGFGGYLPTTYNPYYGYGGLGGGFDFGMPTINNRFNVANGLSYYRPAGYDYGVNQFGMSNGFGLAGLAGLNYPGGLNYGLGYPNSFGVAGLGFGGYGNGFGGYGTGFGGYGLGFGSYGTALGGYGTGFGGFYF